MRTSQFKACVDKRVNQGFTVYQSNFRDGDVDGFFGRNLDFMQKTDRGFLPNLDLFRNNADKKMFYLADKGLFHAVGYAWCFDMERMGKERFCKFAKYVAARYGALPVAWTVAGELPGYMGDKEYVAAEWAEVARTGREYVSRIIGPDMMRRLAYLIIQCGGCGYSYGCNGVWELQSMKDFSWTRRQESALQWIQSSRRTDALHIYQIRYLETKKIA